MKPCTLYRCKYLPDLGYVVYRNCFDPAVGDAGIRAHKDSVFVDEIAALWYCTGRNRLVDELGTDALPLVVLERLATMVDRLAR